MGGRGTNIAMHVRQMLACHFFPIDGGGDDNARYSKHKAHRGQVERAPKADGYLSRSAAIHIIGAK